tara:strand:- start:1746 stop:2078 length:333 start_codon:yes stop_codon:yes gene_type:complete
MTKEKKKSGRPKKHNVDPEKVEQLAGFGCTNTEICSFFDFSNRTLTRNYAENLAKGRDKGKIRLRQLQWRAAEKGNTSMLIWLGKQILGQTEKTEVSWENPVGDVEFIDV